MDKEMELHIDIYDGDDSIRYIKEDDFIKTIKNIQETIQINHQLIDMYKDRIDKAIEYIEQLKFAFDFDKDVNKFAFDFLYTKEGRKLLEILKGE